MKNLTFAFLLFSFAGFAQQNNSTLSELFQQFRQQEIADSLKIEQLIAQKIILERTTVDSTGTVSLIGFGPNGHPIYFATDNSNAAATVGVNLIVSGATNGYGLTGGGILIGEWDGGEVRASHQEFGTRVTQIDNPSSLSDHATHVCGTMIASGVQAAAKGMATAATVSAHSFNNDLSEMTTFANANNILSNHSYGTITGWRSMGGGNWRWYGDTTVSATEDINFGRYNTRARQWDLLANAAPHYLMVKSAGNDRNDVPPASVTSHEVWGNGAWVTSTASRPQDGGTSGYDCISTYGNAKNILTVGAVGDISGGYTQPSDVNMSSFSGWGPTDDGRIKPDIVANGVSLYSTGSLSNTDYYSSSGTSMSAPNATGAMALLQEMYDDSNGHFMAASTLKALVIHTANEAGTSDGPDYQHGWGLLNAKGAADLIADTIENKIIEDTLSNSGTNVFTFYADGTQDVEATIVWNDPAASIPSYTVDNSTILLVNDLDLRISDGTTTKLPWTLNPSSPANAAVKADNVRDNVEKVVFDSPSAGTYTFTISHKGTLANSQAFSLIISGVSNPPSIAPPVVAFSGTPTSLCEGQSVQFSHTTSNTPTSIEWTFTGGSPSTSTAASPQITYTSAGTYAVKLKATNAGGSDSLEIVNYITVNAAPTVTHLPIGSLCTTSSALTLSGGTPTGGTYSGTGVSAGQFNPAVAGVGSHEVYYTVTNSAGCSTIDTIDITVNAPTTYTITDTTVCENSGTFSITNGLPLGGTYSGAGVSNNTFNPSTAGTGTHTIYYTNPSSPCAQADSAVFTVTAAPNAQLTAIAPVCSNTNAFTLSNGSPSGGSYFGNGVSNGSFDPSVAGTGNQTISYVVTANGCMDTATVTIQVNNTVSYQISDTAICLSTPTFNLSTGLPAGGVYSGIGVNNNSFDAATAGIGTHTIYYGDASNSCAITDSATFTVLNAPTAQLSSFANICDGATPITLSGGTPAGGTYIGTGVNNGIFNPSAAGSGTHVISYVVTLGGCADTATTTIQVTGALAEITNLPNYFCSNGSDVVLIGNPAGGTFSGFGLTDSLFQPSTLSPGSVQLTYTTTTGACPGSTTYDVSIASPPQIGSIVGPHISSNNVVASYFVPAQNGAQYSWVAQNGTITSTSNNQATVLWGSGTNGLLTAIQTNNYGCSDSTTLGVELWVVGIESPDIISDLNYFPNPMEEELTITAHVAEQGNYEIAIINISGQTVISQQIEISSQSFTTQINTQSLAKGQYLLHIKKENKNIAVGKLIKP